MLISIPGIGTYTEPARNGCGLAIRLLFIVDAAEACDISQDASIRAELISDKRATFSVISYLVLSWICALSTNCTESQAAALGCDINRSTQHIGQNVLPVFDSLTSF